MLTRKAFNLKHLLFFLILAPLFGQGQTIETDPSKRVHNNFRQAGACDVLVSLENVSGHQPACIA